MDREVATYSLGISSRSTVLALDRFTASFSTAFQLGSWSLRCLCLGLTELSRNVLIGKFTPVMNPSFSCSTSQHVQHGQVLAQLIGWWLRMAIVEVCIQRDSLLWSARRVDMISSNYPCRVMVKLLLREAVNKVHPPPDPLVPSPSCGPTQDVVTFPESLSLVSKCSFCVFMETPYHVRIPGCDVLMGHSGIPSKPRLNILEPCVRSRAWDEREVSHKHIMLIVRPHLPTIFHQGCYRPRFLLVERSRGLESPQDHW